MKFLTLIIAFLIAPMAHASENIHIKDAYMYETRASMPAAAVFMVVMNHGDADDELVGFTTDAAERAELHTMTHENEIMKMRKVDGYVVEGNDGTVTLEPMGNHIMLFGLKKDAVAGDEINGTLSFENAGDVPVTIHVKKRGEKAADHGDHDQDDHNHHH
jgi:hypothetical protein